MTNTSSAPGLDTYDPDRDAEPVKPGDTLTIQGHATLILQRTP